MTTPYSGEARRAFDAPLGRGMIAALYAVSFVYTVALGISGGMLLQMLVLSSGQDGESFSTRERAQADFFLQGHLQRDDLDVSAYVEPFAPDMEHGRALMDNYLAKLALDPARHTLLRLTVENSSKSTSVDVPGGPGGVTLRAADGRILPSLPLPRETHDIAMRRRLTQTRPAGKLAPRSRAEYWLLFEGPVDFRNLKEGVVHLPGGDIELEVVAIGG